MSGRTRRRAAFCLVAIVYFVTYDFINLKISTTAESLKNYNWKKSTSSIIEYIAVHPKSSIAEDVVAITHFPSQAKISVTLQSNARCRCPYIRGRLSGFALVIVQDWQCHGSQMMDHNDNIIDNNATVWIVEGVYPTPPIPGIYFLELIVVFCDNFLLTPPLVKDGVWNNNIYDFARTCTEDAEQRQLTSADAMITVVDARAIIKTDISGDIHPPPGFWIHKHNVTMNPLFTRYQLAKCYRNVTPECTMPATTLVEPFLVYSFQYSNKTLPLHVGNVELTSNAVTICIAGSSHARKMFEYLTAAVNDTLDIMNVVFQYHDVRMPHQVTVEFVRSMIKKSRCQRLIVSVGQWPAGKHFRVNADSPWTIDRFYNEYSHMAQRLYSAFPTLPTIYRSINYNPLGALIGSCPPTDWRSPTTIDGYNAAIRHAIEDLQQSNINNTASNASSNVRSVVQFVDTDFLVGPLWDAASDWCHLDQPIGLLQGFYIVQQALLMGEI
jgi:hypothetical protein